MTGSRLAGADFVRAAACMMVLAHHVAQRVSPEVLGDWAPVSIFIQMFAFGVGAFFVLSGYLLARPFWKALDAGETMPSLATYALRRAARILPGFWLALTVSFLLSFLVLGSALDGALILRFVAGFFMVADFHWLTWFPTDFNPPLWSIGAEATSYALLPLCLWLVFALPFARGWAARLLWVAVLGIIVAAQFAILAYLEPDPIRRGWQYGLLGGAKFWWPNYNPVSFFAMFAVGALVAGIQVRVAALRSIWFDAVALAGLAVAIGALAVNYPVSDAYGLAGVPYGFPWFPIGVGMILLATPSAVILPRLTEVRPIAYVAQVSFGIYVWHYLLMEIVRVLWEADYVYWGMRDVGAWAWISLVIVVLSFVIATLSYRFIEEPVIRWARGLEKSPGNAAPTLSPAAG